MADIIERIAYAINTVCHRTHLLMTPPADTEHDADYVLLDAGKEITRLRTKAANLEEQNTRLTQNEYVSALICSALICRRDEDIVRLQADVNSLNRARNDDAKEYHDNLRRGNAEVARLRRALHDAEARAQQLQKGQDWVEQCPL